MKYYLAVIVFALSLITIPSCGGAKSSGERKNLMMPTTRDIKKNKKFKGSPKSYKKR